MRDSHQTKIHFKVPCPCLSALSLPSIQGCIPTQALIIREVSISNPTDPWLASRHQPMGWLHLPTTKHTVKWFYAPQRWVGNLFSGWFVVFFSPLKHLRRYFRSFTWKVHLSAGKPKVRLTSDSPALNGSSITFTAKLEYPPCQKEDANGNLIWDEHCEDGTELEASGAAKKARPGQAMNLHTHSITPPQSIMGPYTLISHNIITTDRWSENTDHEESIKWPVLDGSEQFYPHERDQHSWQVV